MRRVFPGNTTVRNKNITQQAADPLPVFFVRKIVWQKSRAYTVKKLGIDRKGREVNYPPLMCGVPHLEVGGSAPWSLSFPAYEESSLQDDCNHPNLKFLMDMPAADTDRNSRSIPGKCERLF